MITTNFPARFRSAVFALAAAVFSGGCSGSHISSEEMHSFTVGEDVETAVIAKFGTPTLSLYSVDMFTVKGLEQKIKISDFAHKIDIYQFSVPSILLKDEGYTELNIFVFGPDGKLYAIDEYTCYTLEGCQKTIETEKLRYQNEDLAKIAEELDNRKKAEEEERELAGRQRERAKSARVTRTAGAKRTAGAGKSTHARRSVTTPARAIKAAPAAPAATAPSGGSASSGAAETDGKNAPVRRNLQF